MVNAAFFQLGCRSNGSINRGRHLLRPKKKQELGLVIIDNNSSGNNRVVVIPSFRSRSMTPSGGTARGHYRAPTGSSVCSGDPSISSGNDNSAKTHNDTCPAAAVADAGAVAAAPVIVVGAEGAEGTEGAAGATDDSSSVDGTNAEETRCER